MDINRLIYLMARTTKSIPELYDTFYYSEEFMAAASSTDDLSIKKNESSIPQSPKKCHRIIAEDIKLNSILLRFKKIVRILELNINKGFKPLNITFPQFLTLWGGINFIKCYGEETGFTADDIAQISHQDSRTVYTNLMFFSENGWASKKQTLFKFSPYLIKLFPTLFNTFQSIENSFSKTLMEEEFEMAEPRI